MEDSSFTFAPFLTGFLFYAACYIVPVGLVFLLMKITAAKTIEKPYRWQNLGLLCLPGTVYSLLENSSSRQGLNFVTVMPWLVLFGILTTVLLHRVPVKIMVAVGCALAMVLWLAVPKASMKLF